VPCQVTRSVCPTPRRTNSTLRTSPHPRACNLSTVCSGRTTPAAANPPIPLDPQTRQQTREIASELAAIARTGEVLPGTLTQRQMRCGRAGCRCHADPPRLHGPYWQWTRKVNNKTITRWLSPQQATDCGRWIDNDRRLRELLARLEAIGIGQLEAAQRQD
jgi:hypothetical protein